MGVQHRGDRDHPDATSEAGRKPGRCLYEPEQLMELIRFASGKRVSFAPNKEIALCPATDYNWFYDPGDIINRINLETLGKVCDWLAEAAESR